MTNAGISTGPNTIEANAARGTGQGLKGQRWPRRPPHRRQARPLAMSAGLISAHKAGTHPRSRGGADRPQGPDPLWAGARIRPAVAGRRRNGAAARTGGRIRLRDDWRGFGAREFVDLDNDALEDVGGIDLVFDVIGGNIQKRSAGLVRAGGTLVSIVGPAEARPADGLAVDFVVEFDRAQLSEIVQRVRDGRLPTNIGNVSTLDDAVAALNPTERIWLLIGYDQRHNLISLKQRLAKRQAWRSPENAVGGDTMSYSVPPNEAGRLAAVRALNIGSSLFQMGELASTSPAMR